MIDPPWPRIVVDPSVPPDVLKLCDPLTGKTLLAIDLKERAVIDDDESRYGYGDYWRRRHDERPMDLGHGVRAAWFGVYDVPDDVRAGITLSHVHDDGFVCEGSVMFDVPETAAWGDAPKWRVESYDPLTISPSVHQTTCGLHGFIRGGRWVPA